MFHFRKQKKIRTENGSAIIYALVLVVAAATIFTGIVSFVISQVRYGLSAEPKKSALQIAEAGAFFYRWHLAHEVDGKVSSVVDDYWDTTNDPLAVDDNGDGDCDDADTADGDGGGTEWYEADYEGIGAYRVCVTRPVSGTTIATVYVEGWEYGHEEKIRAIEMRVRRPSWSEFAILSNEALDLENGVGDSVEIDGKVHANGGVRFDENGIARNTVSSSEADYEYGGVTKDGVWTSAADPNTVFLGGTSFPVPTQDFSSVKVLFDELELHADLEFNPGKEMHITFTTEGNGKVVMCEIKGNDIDDQLRIESHFKACETHDLGDITVIYIKQRAYVDGTLETDKKVVIATEHAGHGNQKDKIFINGDLIHEDPTSDSVIGLAAEAGIYVIGDPVVSPAVPGGGDLNSNGRLDVEAALLSQGGPFERDSNFDPISSEIRVFGAIATNNGVQLNNVGDINVIYDQRLLYAPPPYFPTGSIYLIDQWQEIEPW